MRAAAAAAALALAVAAASACGAAAMRFMVIGDWGTGDGNQMRVARAMMDMVRADGSYSMILSTGDQMYPSGAASVADEQFESKFESVFFPGAPAGALPFFMSLGNHDCEGSVSAMVNYTSVSPSRSWKMPGRYYFRDFDAGGAGAGPRRLLRLVVADACNIVCGPTADDEPSNFRCAKVTDVGDDRAVQLEWLDRVLRDDTRCAGEECAGEFDEGEDREIVWRVVLAHWPLYSVLGNGPTETMIRLLRPVLERHGVDMYFNGARAGAPPRDVTAPSRAAAATVVLTARRARDPLRRPRPLHAAPAAEGRRRRRGAHGVFRFGRRRVRAPPEAEGRRGRRAARTGGRPEAVRVHAQRGGGRALQPRRLRLHVGLDRGRRGVRHRVRGGRRRAGGRVRDGAAQQQEPPADRGVGGRRVQRLRRDVGVRGARALISRVM